MATKIRGITIELGADASGLEKALKGVNSQISSTQKQLKDVDRLLKLDPKNTELLEQKQRLLADSVSNTRTKLDALKEAQKQVGEELEKTGEGQEQYDALTREIASTELKLKDAEKAANSFNVTNQKIAATAKDLSQKFGTLAQKTKGISMAAGGALVGLGAIAVKAGKDADELNTLAKQTGLTTAELQKMQYASDLVDVDVDTITSSMKKLKKNMTGHAETWKKIGVEVKKSNGEFKGISDVFYEAVEGLSQISDETERDIIAMDLFGKSADELAGIIDDGGRALRELGAEAENMGLIISQEDLDRANEMNDSLDRLKAQATASMSELGIQLAEMIMPYIPQIEEALQHVLEIIRSIGPETLAIVSGVLSVTAALSPMFSVLSSISSIVSTISGSTGSITAALGGAAGTIGIVVAAVAVLVAAFITLMNTNDEFKAKMTSTWDDIKAKFDETGGHIVEKLNEMGFQFESFSEVVSSIWTGFCEMLGPTLETSFGFVVDMISNTLLIIMGIFDIFAGLFSGNWELMWMGVKEVFFGIISQLVDFFSGTMNAMVAPINAIITGINKIGSAAGKAVNIPLIPHIGKEMVGLASGGILTGGTAIVGEAGPELISVSDGRAMVTPLSGDNDIGALLETYLPYLAAGTQMVMDSGALVGSIAPDMNTALGTIAIRGGRR